MSLPPERRGPGRPPGTATPRFPLGLDRLGPAAGGSGVAATSARPLLRPQAPLQHAALDVDALAAQASFRTEHQTFIPLPDARQAVFTILVESRPLAGAIDSPERARQLHDALASMSDAVLAYRRLTDARDRLLAWLATQAA